jgi:AcrR family transcriptional regulator
MNPLDYSPECPRARQRINYPVASVVLTSVQQQRRADIVIAALGLATDGYDAVHIRAVAERAEVAASTVYQYFSSKDDLLLSCLHHWLTDYAVLTPPITASDTAPYQRLLFLIKEVTESLCAMPRLAEALARAYLCANGDAVENAGLVRHALSQMFTNAIEPQPQTRHREQVGELLTDVWAANIIAIVQNRVSVADLLRRLECAVTAIRHSENRYALQTLTR